MLMMNDKILISKSTIENKQIYCELSTQPAEMIGESIFSFKSQRGLGC